MPVEDLITKKSGFSAKFYFEKYVSKVNFIVQIATIVNPK